jgi:hypothetical protein
VLVRSQADLHRLTMSNISTCTYHSLRSLHQKFEYSGIALRSKALVCNTIELEDGESLLRILIVIWLLYSNCLASNKSLIA